LYPLLISSATVEWPGSAMSTRTTCGK
jgi:hypothetical protein